jgi:hypothetical protein
MPNEIWARGACREAPTDLFYPERNSATYPSVAAAAKKYCRGPAPSLSCPVLLECLFFGLVTEDRFGIWGGMSPRERNAMRRHGALDRYREAQHHAESPYYALIENYLEQRDAAEDPRPQQAREGEQPEAAQLPGCQEA